MPDSLKRKQILMDFTEDYERLQAQKNRTSASIELRILTNMAFVAGEQWLGSQNRMLFTRRRDPNKLQLVFNLIDKLLQKVLGRIHSVASIFRTVPDKDSASARAQSEVANKLLRALDQKLSEDTLSWQRGWWMAVGGVAYEHIPWIEDATVEPLPKFSDKKQKKLLWMDTHTGDEISDEAMQMAVQAGEAPERFEPAQIMVPAGDVGGEILSPLQVFLDAATEHIEDLSPDQAVHIAKIRTLGWIEANYNISVEVKELIDSGTQTRIIKTAFETFGNPTGGTTLQDLVPTLTGTRGANDPPMAVVVERYQAQSKLKPSGRYSVFIPGIDLLKDGPNPYEEIPIVDFHWTPVTTSHWTKDFITDLIPGQRFLNKRLSQLGEQSNASLYANELLGPGITANDISPDIPHPIEGGVTDQGLKMVQRRDPPQLPGWFMQSIELTLRLVKEIAGGPDLLDDSSFPGQLRGPLAVPMLQEIMDSQWGHLYKHLGERTARVKQMRLNRVKQFYPATRTMHYTDRNQKDEVLEFHAGEILRAGTEFNVTVERSSLMPELKALREARITERLNGPLAALYVDERTGRLDTSKIASDLEFGDLERENREAQYRKLAGELIDKLWRAEQLPPTIPLPFWDHSTIMDEMEAAMATTEYLNASPQLQQGFTDYWNKSRGFLQQAAEAADQAVQNAQVKNAVAQATQQAAAQAAAQAIEEARGVGAAAQQTNPTAQQDFDQATQQAQQQGQPQQPQQPGAQQSANPQENFPR